MEEVGAGAPPGALPADAGVDLPVGDATAICCAAIWQMWKTPNWVTSSVLSTCSHFASMNPSALRRW